MKFGKYINEKLENSLRFKAFFDFHKKNPNIIFVRGLYGSFESNQKLKVFNNRQPLGTKKEIFNLLNNWLQKNNHNRRDNSISCVSIKSLDDFDFIKQSHNFGKLFCVVPIGPFSYTWIPDKDLNDNENWKWHNTYLAWFFKEKIKFLSNFINSVGSNNFLHDLNSDEILDLIKVSSDITEIELVNFSEKKMMKRDWKIKADNISKYFTTDKNIIEAAQNWYEIWINCNEYMIFGLDDYKNFLNDEIK